MVITRSALASIGLAAGATVKLLKISCYQLVSCVAYYASEKATFAKFRRTYLYVMHPLKHHGSPYISMGSTGLPCTHFLPKSLNRGASIFQLIRSAFHYNYTICFWWISTVHIPGKKHWKMNKNTMRLRFYKTNRWNANTTLHIEQI
jgi:hypothetical protein